MGEEAASLARQRRDIEDQELDVMAELEPLDQELVAMEEDMSSFAEELALARSSSRSRRRRSTTSSPRPALPGTGLPRSSSRSSPPPTSASGPSSVESESAQAREWRLRRLPPAVAGG